MVGAPHELHQGLAQDYPSFQPQPSSRPPSQPHQQVHATPQRIQQTHQTLNQNSHQPTPTYQATHSSSTHSHSQQFVPFQMAAGTTNQPNFQHHSSQSHSLSNYNPSHLHPKTHPIASHQVIPTPPPIARPSQHQMAQHLMNLQGHMRSQRLMQQQHQQQLAHHREEQMMTCDPLDCFNNRGLALRRYTNNHINMNSILGTHWTVNQLLRDEHVHLVSKRKWTDGETSNQILERKERLKQKIKEIERDIETSKVNYQAQLSRIQSA